MAHSDWMRSARRVSHKVDITSYIGPRSRVYLYTYGSELDDDGYYVGVDAYNNSTTEYNEENVTTNYGSGKNVGFFDGPNKSIHLMSEKLSYNLNRGGEDERGNVRLATKFITDENCDISGYVNGNPVNYFIFDLTIWPGEENVSPTTRYVQISGNKNTNDYPVDFEVTNNTSGITYKITNNSKVDCIIDFGAEIDVSGGMTIKITKWSKPYSSVKFSYIGFNVTFDVSDLLRTYNIDDGCAYDGGDTFSYGLKSNSGSLSLFKDKNNNAKAFALVEDSKSCENILTSRNFTYSYTTDSTLDDGVEIDGVKRYYIANGNDELFISRPIGWYMTSSITSGMDYNNINNGYGVVTFDVYNHSNEDLYISPDFIFIFNTSSSTGYGYKSLSYYLEYPQVTKAIRLEPGKWNKISYISNNKWNPSDIKSIRSSGRNYIKLNTMTSSGGTPSSYKLELKDIYCGIITDEQVTTLGLEEETLYSDTIYYDKSIQKIVLERPSSIRVVSKVQSIIENDNVNVKVSVSTVGDTFNQIANMWVSSYDYDNNGLGVTFVLNDIFLKMSKHDYIGSVIDSGFNGYVDGYLEGYVTQRSFWPDVQFGKDLKLLNSTTPNFNGEPNILSIMPTVIDDAGVKYFDVFDRVSKATNTFIVQDLKDDDLSFKYCNKDSGYNYKILNSQCYSISDKRYEKNNISRVSVNPVVVSTDSSSSVLYRQDGFTVTTPKCYLSPTLEEKDGVDAYLLMNEITLEGTISIPIDSFKEYDNLSVALECITSYRKINHNGVWWTDPIGEVIGDSSSVKQYLKYDETDDGETDRRQMYTSQMSSVGDENITTVSVNNRVSILDIGDTTVTVSYYLSYNPINYKPIFGQSMTSERIGSVVVWSTDFIQKYLGAYRVVLVGSKNSYESSSVTYGDETGNSMTIYENPFIQQGSSVYSSSLTSVTIGADLSGELAKDIYREYCAGKKIAKIEYIGSPYLKVYDIITLENGISYRIFKIKHISNGGGFKQSLTLIEKE